MTKKTAAPAFIPAEDLLYIIALDAFVVKNAEGYYDTQTLLGKEAARNYLSTRGHAAAAIKVYLNGMGYLKVRRLYADAAQPQICIAPNGESCLNSYIQPTLTPATPPYDYPTITRVLNNITNDDPAGLHWLRHWVAAKVQKPTEPLPTAVALLGASGTGKSTFVRVIAEMLGMRNCVILGQNLLASGFTAGWAGRCFVNVDEAVSGEDNISLSYKVKRILTADEVEYHAKGRDPIWVKNCAAWVFTSNGMLAVREDDDDRRMTSFVQTAKPPLEYVKALKDQFDGTKPTASFSREIAAFKADLLTLEVDRKLITSPHTNNAKRDIAALSRNSVEDFFAELTEHGLPTVLEEVQGPSGAARWDDIIPFPKDLGEQPDENGLVHRTVVKSNLYALYTRYAKQYGQRAVNKNRFFATAQQKYNMNEGRRQNNSRTLVVWWKDRPAETAAA